MCLSLIAAHTHVLSSFLRPLCVRYAAVMARNVDMIGLLLSHGADVNVIGGGTARSPLHLACARADYQAALTLLQNGADLEQKDAADISPQLLIPPQKGYRLKLLCMECVSLCAAAEANDLDRVRHLVEAKTIPLNVRGLRSQTPLHLASSSNAGAVVAFLLKHHADPNTTASLNLHQFTNVVSGLPHHLGPPSSSPLAPCAGRTPLHMAVLNDHSAVCAALLHARADPSLVDSNGFEPMHYAQSIEACAVFKRGNLPVWLASQVGDVPALEKLLRRGGGGVDSRSPRGHTGLQIASALGSAAVVESLLKHKASPNLVGGDDLWTPLHQSCIWGHANVTSMLLAAGADPDSRDKSNLTVAERVGRQMDELCKLRKEAEARVFSIKGEQPRETAHIRQLVEKLETVHRLLLRPHQRLETAVKQKNIRAVEALLKNGDIDFDVAIPGSDDLMTGSCMNLLHWKYSDRPLIALLVKSEADVNLGGTNLHTPLHEATRHGNTDIVACLLELSAEIDCCNAALSTPLHMAARDGNLEVIRLLIQNKASRSLVDEDGDTAFDCAREITVMKLLAQGAQLLAVAVLEGEEAQVALLLEQGVCGVNDRVIKDKTALHLACRLGEAAITWTLLQQNADVELVAGRYDFTPLHYAAHEGRVEIVRLLLAFNANRNARDADGKKPVDLADTPDVQELLKPERKLTSITVAANSSLDSGSGAGANEGVDDKGVCKICLENAVDSLVLPCGHLVSSLIQSVILRALGTFYPRSSFLIQLPHWLFFLFGLVLLCCAQAFCFSCVERTETCALCRADIEQVVRVFKA